MLTEVFVQHQVIPGIAAFARGGLPEPAMTDDGNEWVDGYCWLFCGQQWTRVLWIGPANVAGAQAPMYACGPCIRELQDRVGRPYSWRTNQYHRRLAPAPGLLFQKPNDHAQSTAAAEAATELLGCPVPEARAF